MAEAIRDGKQENQELSSLMSERQSSQRKTRNNWSSAYNKIVRELKISTLSLNVASGPSSGCRASITSAMPQGTLTIGRAPTNSLIIKDPEVSAEHAVVKFDYETQKWEISDLGSLNETFLNFKAMHRRVGGIRDHSHVTALSNEDVITFSESSNVLVEITQKILANSPRKRVACEAVNDIFHNPDLQRPNLKLRRPGIGMASDPMAKRLGGRTLPMEDFGLWHYPIPGVEKFGLVGVFDGFAGSEAAAIASKTFHENVAMLLSQSGEKEKVLSSDASGILEQAFALTETEINKHVECEGSTATTLLIWSSSDGDLFAQCANLGDTECVIYIGGKTEIITEVHKLDSPKERSRLDQTGKPLEEGQSRIGGVTLSRMFGSKYLKSRYKYLISEPYVSKAQRVPKESTGFAIVASDGLWDVLTKEEAVKFVLENKEWMKNHTNYAELIAKSLIWKAALRRTKDNTTVAFVDFDILRTYS